jgi:putative ABC transport system permease protein
MIRWLQVLGLRLRSLTRRGAVDRELERELGFHLEEHIAELMADGMTREEAKVEAMRAFGSHASVAQQCRDSRRVNFLENVQQDARYAIRTLAKQPMLVATAALSIALGVGANLAIFGIANSLLLSTPTAADVDQLVNIRSNRGSHVSYSLWRELSESRVLDGVAGHQIETDVNWRSRDASISLTPLVVTANFFEVLGVPLVMGRGFTSVEAAAERDPRLAVVSHAFWTTKLASDPAVLGSTLVLNGEPFTVLGVLPADLRSLPGFGIAPDLWLPMSRALAPDLHQPRASHVQLVGRLRDGQTTESAHAALNSVLARSAGVDAKTGEGLIKYVGHLGGLNQTNEFKEVTVFFGVLIFVTWLVLGIACANVAGLLLARSAARRKEIAMRLAIGASRARVVQQLLTEGFVLSIIGTLAGLVLTAGVGRLLSRVSLPLPFPFAIQFSFDGRIATLAIVLVVLSTVCCALAPALHATGQDLLPGLKQDVRSYFQRRFNLRALLVTGQVTVSALLLVVTILFLRNVSLARTAAPGFDADRTLLAQVTFVEGRQGGAANAAIERIVDRVRALPGVEAAAFASGVPLTLRNGGTTGTRMRIDGHESPIRVDYDNNTVGPDYFRTMGIGLLLGREFAAGDRMDAPQVAIVNEEFVRRYFDGRNPLGRAIYLEGFNSEIRAEVVGVVANSKYTSIGEERDAAVYTPYLMRPPDRLVQILVRTAGAPASSQTVVRDAILEGDPDAAVAIEPMTSALRFAFLPSRVGAVLVGSLGTLGTLLAMIGLYGVVSFAVTRRTREIGIRMALGSSRRAVARLVLRDGALLVVIGLALGLTIALIVTRPLSAFLVAALPTTDPWSFAGTALLLAVTSVVAGWGPSRRAMRIEPAETLRAE